MRAWSVTYDESELQEIRQLLALSWKAMEQARADVASCGRTQRSCDAECCENSRRRLEFHTDQVEKHLAKLSKANRGVTKC